MLSMPEIDGIRRMDREGMTPVEIARATNHDPKTVRKYIEMDDFSPKPPEMVERPSILDPHKPFIDEILTGDLKVRRKQRHSGTRIYERLRDERGYTGGITTVRVYVARRKAELGLGRQAFLDLVWAPGSLQADFFDADIIHGGKVVRAHVLCVCFPH